MKNKVKSAVKFKSNMFFGGVITGLYIFSILVCLALIVMDIILLAGNYSTSIVIVSVSLGASVLIITAVLIFIFNSKYVFTEDEIVVKLFVFVDRVKYDDVDGLKQDEKDGTIYVHASPENKSPITFRLNLPEKNMQSVKDILLEKCSVTMETFKLEKKKK